MRYTPAPLRVFPPAGPHQWRVLSLPTGGSTVCAGFRHSAPAGIPATNALGVLNGSISAKAKPLHHALSCSAIAAVTAMLLSACGASNQGNEWFPLRAGDAQTYVASYDTDAPHDPDTWTLTTQGPTQLNGKALMQRRHSDGVTYYFDVSEQGIRRLATRMDIDQEPTIDPEPRWVIKAPYAVGTEWTASTVPYLVQRINEYPRDLKYTHQAQMTWRIEAVDDEVQLGNGDPPLKPCLRLRGEAALNLYTDSVNGFTDVPLISKEWYCKNHGLVKFERTEKVPKGFLTGGVLVAAIEP